MGTLQFVLGDANGNHQETIVQLAKKGLAQQKTIYFIVPNNMKYELEVSLLQHLSSDDEPAAVQVQIFSFSRLAWYLLQSIQEIPQPELSGSGMQMILRQLLRQNKEQLHLFRGEMKKTGFIEKLARLILEFQTAHLSVADLKKMAAESTGELDDKLHDFCLIYEQFNERVKEYSIGSNTSIDYLIHHIQQFDLQNTLFIVTGFHHFTAQEQALLQALMLQSSGVIVDLILDQEYKEQLPETLDLYYSTAMVYHRLYKQARENQVALAPTVHTYPCHVSRGITALNRNWQVMKGATKQSPLCYQDEVEFWKFSTIQKEVERVAIEIKRLVQAGKQYRDIVVLTRDLPHYQLAIQPIFQSFNIPYNVSQSQSMAQHPLTVLFESLFGLLKFNFRYRDIMRFLRTELVVPYGEMVVEDENETEYHQQEQIFRDEVDRLENVMLAFDYSGSAFTMDKDWQISLSDDENQWQERINQVRRFVCDVIQPLKKQISQSQTSAEAVRIFYQFLIQWHVDQQVMNWRYCAEKEGRLLQAKMQEQTWTALMELFDDYVELMGEEPFDLEEFEAVLMQGMTTATYSHVPTTLDQVAVMDLIRAPYNREPIVFILGVTNSNMPKKVENETLLSDEDRQWIDHCLENKGGKFIGQQTSMQLANESFFAYVAMMRATEHLYLTYSQDNEIYEKDDLSPYVKTLLRLGEGTLSYEESEEQPSQFDGRLIVTKRQFMSELVKLERQARDENQPLNRNWKALASVVKQDEQLAPMMEHILSSVDHQNIANPLPTELVERLYGKTMFASVSRFEVFNQCAYRYYLQYGLKLRERTEYSLSSVAMGEFFHEALDQFVKELLKQKSAIRLADFKEENLIELLNHLMDKQLKQEKYAILQRSKHMNYIRAKLKQIIRQVVWAMYHQSERSQSKIHYTELLFGNVHGEQGLKPLVYHVDKQHQLKIRGKIDRLDLIKMEDKAYMTVIDYKSSAHQFSFQDAYYGLAMQLLTYLDVALTNADELFQMEVLPAGALYMLLKNPVVDLRDSLDEEQYQQTMLKQYKQKGILLNDATFLHQMDQQLESGFSPVIDVRLLKNQQFSNSGSLLSADELNQLLRHNEDHFLRSGKEIYQGKIDIQPYRYQQKEKACTYCPYRSVCQFDPLLAENHYRDLKPLDRKTVLSYLEGGKEDEE